MAEIDRRPAFYAARPGRWRDWWTVLHPPYTLWHLSYVVLGASLAPSVELDRLVATVMAFFLAVGIAAHALDELQGRPLGTGISARSLVAASVSSLAGAVTIGIVGTGRVGGALVPFIVIGPVLVLGYNLELARGRLHTDAVFALAWGTFPLLTGYVAQAERLDWAALLGGAAAYGFSRAQRSLSSPARLLRRRVLDVGGVLALADGATCPLDRERLLAPLERTLRALSWSLVALALALATARLG